MPHKLLTQFRDHWSAKTYSRQKQSVLLAVSGGEDSMVMADLFLKSDIPFAVAHCNFGLRGKEADLDEQLVHDWCKLNTVVFHSIRFDTKQKAAEWKTGTQETARILRYEWFEQIRAEHEYLKIVTAHHANDNVETLLINLFKGTGISGMHGILPENGNIVRPLLFAGKDLISSYSAENEIIYRDDASNASDDYLRNAVRHNVIPTIQQWFPGAVTNVNESIARFAEVELLYKKAIEQDKKKLLEQRGPDYYIPILRLRHHNALSTICYELLHPFGFSSAQVPHILELLHVETGRYISSSSHRVIRNRDFLIVTALPAGTTDLIVVDAFPAIIDSGKYHFSFSVQDKPKDIPAAVNEAYIDMKEIELPLLLRKWKIGDYFYPLGMNMKKKKVSRLLIDEKVPLHEKADIWILECKKRIAWIAGMRLDERFKIKQHTEKVLVVKRELK